MQWLQRRPKPRPVVGDKRTVIKFLWLPMYMGGFGYWLERVRLIQTYVSSCGYMESEQSWWETTFLERL